jgi:hypothetical protein
MTLCVIFFQDCWRQIEAELSQWASNRGGTLLGHAEARVYDPTATSRNRVPRLALETDPSAREAKNQRCPWWPSQRSASMAAMQPVPAAVMAWRYT